ncbi:MAG: hypothetical protein IPP77_07435 [Bacteroidetes bacterium]|nr:hypothetical protein [Bacteroidota bacterium]
MKIAANTIVSLRYVMKNGRGDILEDNRNNQPVRYLHGSSRILPALQNCLEGLECGAAQSISLHPDSHNGLSDSLHFDVMIDNIRAATEFEIELGEPSLEGKECGPDCCC